MSNLAGKKILILYTAHTLGHQRVGENIGYWLKQGGADVVLREVLKSNPSPLIKKFLRVHVWVYEHAGWLWNFLYRWGFWVVMMPFRLLAADFQKSEIVKILQETKPDVVITTQTSPSAVMSVLKRNGVYQGLWGISFSDYHFHRAWVYPRADFYLANIEAQIASLAKLGISPKKVFCIGLALPPMSVVDEHKVRLLLGIPATAKVILVGSGTLGVRLPSGLYDLLEAVRVQGEASGIDVYAVIACGKNVNLFQAVQHEASHRSWLKALQFYEPLQEVYAASNLMFSKPGGLTIAETLQVGLPVFVTHFLPGQEQLNIQFLSGHKAVVVLYGKQLEDQAKIVLQEILTGGRRSYLLQHSEISDLAAPKALPMLSSFVANLFHKNNQTL